MVQEFNGTRSLKFLFINFFGFVVLLKTLTLLLIMNVL
jgi:hypothetical protein